VILILLAGDHCDTPAAWTRPGWGHVVAWGAGFA